MSTLGDSDKTVANFDLEAFNEEFEKKRDQKRGNQEDFENNDSELTNGFDEDSPDFMDSSDILDDLDDIDDDLFNEESVIARGLQDLDGNKNSASKKKSKKRKRRKSVDNSDKTVVADISSLNSQEEEDDEFDDDIDNIDNTSDASEKTEIFSLSDFEEESSSSIIVELAKIKIIEGAPFEEYSIKQEKVVIGRTENNDIIIPNKTISRNHCEITRTEEGFKITDLNSGNGVKINNKRIKNSKILNSGDIISIGKVKLQFIDMSVERGDASESTGSVILKKKKMPKKNIIIMASIAVVLLIIIGVFVKISQKKKLERLRQEQILKEKLRKENELKKKIADNYSRGIEAYKNKEWNSAINYFTKVLELKPDYTKAKDYKQFAINEKKNKKLIKESEDALLKDDYETAILKLKNVSQNSSYFAEAQDRLKIALNKHKKLRFELAQKSFNDENYETSLSVLNKLISEYPDFEEAIKLKEQVDEKLLEAKKEKEPKKVVSAIKFDESKFKVKRKKKPNKYAKGLTLYGNKQFDAAIKFFQNLSAKKSTEYAENVKKFKKVYLQGIKYLKLKNPSKGIKLFNKALSIDGKLGGKLASDIKSKLSVLYAVKSKVYFGNRDYVRAFKSARKSIILGGKNAEAQKVLNKLEKRARDLYLSAYQQERRNPDVAKRDYKLIISILSPSSKIYQKAKKRLDKLK